MPPPRGHPSGQGYAGSIFYARLRACAHQVPPFAPSGANGAPTACSYLRAYRPGFRRDSRGAWRRDELSWSRGSDLLGCRNLVALTPPPFNSNSFGNIHMNQRISLYHGCRLICTIAQAALREGASGSRRNGSGIGAVSAWLRESHSAGHGTPRGMARKLVLVMSDDEGRWPEESLGAICGAYTVMAVVGPSGVSRAHAGTLLDSLAALTAEGAGVGVGSFLPTVPITEFPPIPRETLDRLAALTDGAGTITTPMEREWLGSYRR